jgi:hypothetical protein
MSSGQQTFTEDQLQVGQAAGSRKMRGLGVRAEHSFVYCS